MLVYIKRNVFHAQATVIEGQTHIGVCLAKLVELRPHEHKAIAIFTTICLCYASSDPGHLLLVHTTDWQQALIQSFFRGRGLDFRWAAGAIASYAITARLSLFRVSVLGALAVVVGISIGGRGLAFLDRQWCCCLSRLSGDVLALSGRHRAA